MTPFLRQSFRTGHSEQIGESGLQRFCPWRTRISLIGIQWRPAITLFAATWLGVPVSTTHTITGAIVGVGASRRLSAVRWNVASSIVVAWVVTLPASAVVGALFYWLAGLF